jgi:drug/metabolite transporter (DMT)-like permease
MLWFKLVLSNPSGSPIIKAVDYYTLVGKMAQLIATLRTGNRETYKIFLALFGLYLIWGSTYLGVGLALESFPPFILSSLRLWLSGVIILGLAISRGERLPEWRLVRNAALIGCIILGTGVNTLAIAEQWVSTGLTALAIAAMPLWAGVFALLMAKRPSNMEWLGLAIGFAGIVLFNTQKSIQAEPLAAIVLILGPMAWAFGSILSQRIALPGGWMAIAIEMIGAALMTTILVFVAGESIVEPPTIKAIAAIIYLALIGSAVGYSAYIYLLNTVRPALATSYAYVNPIVAVMLGIVFLGETISQTGIIAMVVIITGVVIVIFARSKT